MPIDPLVCSAPFPLKGAIWWLDGNDVRPEIGEKLRSHGAHQEVIEAQDANALQKIDHGLAFSFLGSEVFYLARPLKSISDISIMICRVKQNGRPANSAPAHVPEFHWIRRIGRIQSLRTMAVQCSNVDRTHAID
ncbi:hypothetical protein [Bradyrhizobium sp. 160]|uniref:hypothetical protein n=1 Tax=Bradyrhizobium sp. 160 TaxID=2782634 RepID=UPI001FF77B52|nr:hypothetical protein [Bradyrhizobium sp. 160]